MQEETSSSDGLIAALRGALAENDVKTGANLPQSALCDWSGETGGTPLVHVTPRDVAQVSAVMEICSRHGAPVVPQGGMTGLAGGAIPSEGAVLLSVVALDRIEEIDTESALMVVGAGTPLQRIQEEAAAAGFSFPLDLGARGTCRIGGNIATNAGGNRVIRHGMTRDMVLGLEAVLADGTVLSMMNRMPKNNAALDLKHLFIGSEGTLGIVTRAVLRLSPPVAGANAALVALPGIDAAIALLRMAQCATSGRVSAFELMWSDYYDAIVEEGGKRAPLPTGHPVYALIELQGADPDADRPMFDDMLEKAFETGLIADAVVARSEADVAAFWDMRDGISDLLGHRAPTISFDVSVPLVRLGACIEALCDALDESFPDLKRMFFGHAGDSNIHLVAGPTTGLDPSGHGIEDLVYGIVRDFRGSISAEHGIGVHKKRWLGHSRSDEELAVLRQLKATLDPAGILNPGKVL